jgi:ribosomal protein L11 methyltransferase
MAWVSLTIDVAESESEFAQSLMHDHGSSGLEVRDASNQVMPTVRAPARGQAIIVAYFDGKARAQGAERALKKRITGATTALETVVVRDWSTEWRSQIRSVQVGRLWVGPPWEKAKAPTDKVCLFIEPKMAFGTGDHPTTSLCLEAVDQWYEAHPHSSMLDVGTGTGVLAFAAKKLGGTRVIGVDNDPVAVGLAKECAEENGLTGIELSDQTLHDLDGTFDLVAANILANTLIELAPLIVPKVKSRLIVAGVLVHQADDVRAAYLALGMTSAGSKIQGEWIRLDFDAGRIAKGPKKPKRAKPKSAVRARAMKKLAAKRR